MTKDVLVIAADAVLRRSLEFLFEAEGFAVSSHDAIPARAKRQARNRCAVVDESALTFDTEEWARIAELTETIIVLLDEARELPRDMPVHTIEKPVLGAELLETVKAAMRSSDVTA